MSIQLTISNFKSIRKATLALRKGLNILVGPNGSGKTCLLSSLHFIRDILRLGVAQAVARSGGHQRVYRRGSRRIAFEVVHDYGTRLYRNRKTPCILTWSIQIAQTGPQGIAKVEKESIEIHANTQDGPAKLLSLDAKRTEPNSTRIDVYLSPPSDCGRDLFSDWRRSRGTSKARLHKAFLGSTTKDIRYFAKSNPDRSLLPFLAQMDDRATYLYSQFTLLDEYNIVPDVARAATEQLPYASMASDGGSVSEVIDALMTGQVHKLVRGNLDDPYAFGYFPRRGPLLYPHQSSWRRYVLESRPYHRRRPTPSTLREINAQLASAVRPIQSVSVSIDPTTGKRFVVFKAGKHTFRPEEVSDGTIKWLCILVSLYVPFCRVYLLEEPENFLHPWMQQRLVHLMRQQAERAGTVFLLSSHSATMVNVAKPEEILLVRQTARGTQLSQVPNIEQVRAALDSSHFLLGDLWVSGAIGGVPGDE